MCHFWPHPLLGLQAIACQQVHVSSPKFLKSMITPVHSWTLEEVKLFHRVLCPVPNQLAAYQRIQHASPYLPTLDICYLWHLASQGGVYLTDAVQTVQPLKWYLDYSICRLIHRRHSIDLWNVRHVYLYKVQRLSKTFGVHFPRTKLKYICEKLLKNIFQNLLGYICQKLLENIFQKTFGVCFHFITTVQSPLYPTWR